MEPKINRLRQWFAREGHCLGHVLLLPKIAVLNAAAASACMPGRTCWYTVIVKAGLLWPRRSLTTFGDDAFLQEDRGVGVAEVVEADAA